MADHLSERDICTKYITPALIVAGWDLFTQIREEVSFTKGRIIVRGKHALNICLINRWTMPDRILCMGNIAKFLIPTSPLSEQHRIVAKVDELMALCDKLKSRITDARRVQQKLADVLVEQVVA